MIYSITLNPSIDYIVELERFYEGELNRSSNDYFNVGGKGIMVSKLLTNIGVDNVALGFIGGFTGKYIVDWFDAQKMNQMFTNIAGDTRINVKLKSGKESEINGQGPIISKKEELEFLENMKSIKKDDTVIISGSKSRGLENEIFDKIIDVCKSKEADFVIDTSGEDLAHAISRKPLLIKPNIDEIGELFGKKVTTKEEIIPYGKECIKMGAKYVIVSMGAEGALFFDSKNVLFSPKVEGELVNSVGAGDSMLAGFVGKLKGGCSSENSFRYAVASGTATAYCEDIGQKNDIEELLKKVEIIRL